MGYTVDWDQTSTFVREKIIPKVKDQYFKSNALMYRLRPKAEVFTGGRNIVQPLSFAPEGGGGQWWAGSDRFDLRIRNPITAAQFWAKNYELPIVIDQDEEDTVDGPEKLMDLISVKTKIAQRTVMDALGGPNGIYNAGTNPKAITGLDYALPSAATGTKTFPASYTYGGIPSTSTAYTWWNPQCDGTEYETSNVSGAGDYLTGTNWAVWDNMLAAQALASGKTCSMILCNWGVFNEGAGLINKNTTWFRPQQRSDLAQAGINSFMYRNKDVVVDEQVPRGTASTRKEKVYFIDEECCHLWVHSKRNFAFEGWRQLVDQAIKVAYIWFRGELTFDERRSSGTHSFVDTSLTSP